jgi:excisionase family DNA binding protein
VKAQPRKSTALVLRTSIQLAKIDDSELLRAVLASDQRAWSELVRRFEPALRQIVREIIGDDSEADDIVGAFWLRMVEDDMRWLRAFTPSCGASLVNWLTIHVSNVAHEQSRKLKRHRKRTVPLDEATVIAVAPEPARSRPSVDHAIREAVRDVVREEIETVLRRMGHSHSQPATPASEYLSIADAAELVHVHPATLRSWINEGRLRGHRAGRHHRVKRSELEAFLASLEHTDEDFDLDKRARELASA